MKKIFTLLVASAMCFGAYARENVLIEYNRASTLPEGITLIDVANNNNVALQTVKNNSGKAINSIALKKGYGKVVNGDYEYAIKLNVENGFKAGDVVTIAGAINKAEKRATAKLLAISEGKAVTLNTFSDFVNWNATAAEATEESYTLTSDQDVLYLGRDGGTTASVLYIKVARQALDGLSYSAESATVNLQNLDEFVAPELFVPEGLTVTGYTSSVEAVATVNAEGVVTPLADGETVITATANDGTTASYTLHVLATIDPEFAFDKASASVEFGAALDNLPVLVKSADIADSDITYSFSNKYVAEYGNDGVKVLMPGKVLVTCSFAGNSKYNAASASYLLEVTRPYTSVVSEGVVIGWEAAMEGKKEYTHSTGATLAIIHNDNKTFNVLGGDKNPQPLSVNGENINCFKLSNGAPVKITAPEGLVITKVAVYSVVNYDRKGKGYMDRQSYWKNFNGVDIAPDAENTMVNFTDNANYSATPDVAEFDVENLSEVTITNTGEQPAVVFVVNYAIAAPVAKLDGASVDWKGEDIAIDFELAATHHQLYYKFTSAQAPVEELMAKAVDHTGYELAEANKVTVAGPGTLSVYAYDPNTDIKSEPVEITVNDGTSAIDQIGADVNAPVEYFNLQGIRVDNPENGVFIRRQGTTVTKVVK